MSTKILQRRELLISGRAAAPASPAILKSEDIAVAGAVYLVKRVIEDISVGTVEDGESISLTVPQLVDKGIVRTSWLIDVQSAAGVWGFEHFTSVYYSGEGTGVLRVSRALSGGEEGDEPPTVTISAAVVEGNTILTVQNGSGGDLDILIGSGDIGAFSPSELIQ